MTDAPADIPTYLANHYAGRHDGERLWRWAGIGARRWRWTGDPLSSWQAVLGDNPPPIDLLRQALYDHPSDPVYRGALPADGDPSITETLQLLFACCARCPEADQGYRLGQWLILLPDADRNQAFVAAVPLFHQRWTIGQRLSLHGQLQVLTDDDDDLQSLDETVDACIALLAAMCELPRDVVLPAPWQNLADRLHRLLAPITTFHLRLEQDPTNGDHAAARSLAVADLRDQAPPLIEALDQHLTGQGVHGCAALLSAALERIQRAFRDQPDAVPVDLLTGLQQALWATVGCEPAQAWRWEILHDVPVGA